MANGINTVHLSYVREGAGHALIGARQWIPREIARHPVLVMAALAICAVTTALLRHRTDTQAPPPVRPD